MTNEQIIYKLLSCIRRRGGVLEVRIFDSWMRLAEWADETGYNTYYAITTQNSIQARQLTNYFYQLFYLTGTSYPCLIKSTSVQQLSRVYENFENYPSLSNLGVLKKILPNGDAVVDLNATRLVVEAGRYILEPGHEQKLVRIYRQGLGSDYSMEQSPGWLWSDGIQAGFESENEYIRFYLNPQPEKAREVLDTLTKQLESYGLPYRIKRLAAVESTQRNDQMVLYVAQKHFTIASFVIRFVNEKYSKFFRDRLPLFVRQLLPGIGFAEEPFENESFGESRCGWIAEIVLDWFDEPVVDTNDTPPTDSLIKKLLIRDQLPDLENIHLNPDSNYPYDFSIFYDRYNFEAWKKPAFFLLNQAIDIANKLCQEAVWVTSSHFLWVGADVNALGQAVYKPVNASWETGSTGPLLFLYSLNKYVDDPLYYYFLRHSGVDLKQLLSSKIDQYNVSLIDIYMYCPAPADLKTDFASKQELIVETSPGSEPKNVSTDFVPGMNGLSGLGFQCLRACDPMFPPVPEVAPNTEYVRAR